MLLSLEEIKSADAETLTSILFVAGLVEDESEDKIDKLDAVTARCRQLKIYKQFNKVYEQVVGETALVTKTKNVFNFKLDGYGKRNASIENYMVALSNDHYFDGLKYNLLTNAEEIEEDGKVRRWTDTDDAKAMGYIEKTYHFLGESNYYKAMKIIFDERKYHPIKDIIENIKWDGKSRICNFLHEWTMCENTPYTREASRLIFAGGIHRLYQPGCKFDDMVVLIGTNQGEGKSTICKWLAIQDSFFSEVNDFDGQRGTEATEGAWICEVSELLALTKTKEQEAVKSYITRQVERYRMPYDRHVSERPRQCIFIGTTNKSQFLTDKSGNRRFYPIVVNQIGYELYDREDECRDYILQCWAEAKALYDQGKLPAYADRSILEEVKIQQEAAEEDDYRIGMIAEWLEYQKEVCSMQIWVDALHNDITRMTKKDSSDISLIMNKMPGWKRSNSTKRFLTYGTQKYWYNTKPIAEDADELPF